MKSISLLIVILSIVSITNATTVRKSHAMLRAFADVKTGVKPQQATSNSACNKHTLCGSCLTESACVWCADAGGACVSGDVSTGPADAKICKNWEGSYCTAEPCNSYTQCESCTSDAFCGWSSEEKVCVEGDKKGPLTGKVSDGQWRWKSCPATKAATGSATGSAEDGAGVASVEGQASNALKEAEKKIAKMQDKQKKAVETEKTMLGEEKSAFDVIRHLKEVLNAWRGRKHAVRVAEEHDKELFMQAFKDMTNQRASNYKLLQDSYNQMEKSFVRDEAVLDKRDVQVKKFIMAKLNEDAIVNKAGKELKNVSLTPLVTVANETASIKKLESWIASLDNSGRNFVKSIARKAGRSVNAELHIAAVRMEERTEASGYACQFLLCHPDTQCRDFPTMYSGTVGKNNENQISREEQVRVCNSVQNQLDKHPKKPKYAGENCLEQEISQNYLKWCINNVHT